MMNIEKYYEIQWYDNNYSGCWKFNNRFKTLEEAREFIDANRCLSGVDLRIVCKTKEVVETYNKENKNNK